MLASSHLVQTGKKERERREEGVTMCHNKLLPSKASKGWRKIPFSHFLSHFVTKSGKFETQIKVSADNQAEKSLQIKLKREILEMLSNLTFFFLVFS